MPNEPLVFTIPEVASQLSISRSTVYRLIKDGQLEPIRIRSKMRIRSSAVEKYLDRAQRLHRESTVKF